MKKSAKNILLVFGLGVYFSLIFFVFSEYFPSNKIIKEAKAANTITCSVEPFTIKPGEDITIIADVNFDASDVWAMIEGNDGVAQTHYTLIESPANHWEKTYTSAGTATGLYDMALYAEVNGTGEQILCNPSAGSSWIKKTLSSMPWHRRSGHEVLSYGGYIWMFGGSADNFENDVWRSSDGENWELITADAAWPGRYEFGSAVINGKMWIFGGRARNAGNTATIFYNDVWSSINGKDWDPEPTANWTARAMFATSINDNKIWISGGYDGSTVQNQLWYTSDPHTGWTQVSKSPSFDGIAVHQMVTYDHNRDGTSELWIIGGYNFTVPYTKRDVWKANNIGATAWTHLQFCQGGSKIGKVCTVVGDCPDSSCAYNAPWGARNDFSALVYDLPDTPDLGNKILIMGGANDSNAMLNDVWSYEPTYGWQNIIDPAVDHYPYDSQPSTWTNWSGRFRFRTISFDSGSGNKIYFIGGQEYPVRYWNDVWTTTNATDWELIGDQYDGIFSGRWASSMSAFDAGSGEKLWISGGNGRNDLWSSGDGTTWVKVLSDEVLAEGNTERWSQRWMHKTFVYDNKFWLIGGCKAGSGGGGIQCGGICSGGTDNGKGCTKGSDCGTASTCVSAGLNDVWYTDNVSNGLTWTRVTANANFAARYGFSIAVNDEKMWILGGDISGKCSAGTYSGEICRVDGDCPGSVCSKVCVAGSNIGTTCSDASTCGGTGGNCNFLNQNDALYSSDGSNWTLATASAGWSTRFGHNSIFYDNKLWVMGGWHSIDAYNNGTFKNDVWYSADNGASWTLAAANPAWNGRHNFSLVEHRGKMYVYAGNNGFFGNNTGRMDSNNVWSSTDGVTWNQLTGWAEWDGRDFLSYAVFNDRLWLMGGDTMQGNSNEVWASRYGDMTYYVVPEKIGTVNITATVEPELSLSLSANSCSFGVLDATKIKTCGYNVSVATNARSGYTGSISQNHGFETNVNGVNHEIEGENDTPLQIDASGALSGEFGEYGVGIQTADTTDWPEFTGLCSTYNNQATTSLPAKAVDWSTLADPDAYLGDNIENVFATNSEPVDGVNDGLTYFCHGVRITWDAPPGSYDQLVTITVVGNF